MTQLPRRRLSGAAALALIALTTVGCSASSDSAGSNDSSRVTSSDAGGDALQADDAEAAPVPESEQVDGESLESSASFASAPREAADVVEDPERKLISNGNVALQSDDVGRTQFEVAGVADTYAGEVESKESETDTEGEVLRSRLVLRIPTARFIDAMDDLSGTAQLIDNSSSTADVTTEVLDKDIRIEIQRSSIDRIALLLDRAENIRDIVSIEAQLSQRQAELATLEQKQRYLADQTAMSTVTVSIQRTPEEDEVEPDRDTAGFFVGLSDGWDALRSAATGAATAVGAVLPFAVVGGVVGFPLWTVLRRRRRATAVAP